MTADWPAGWRPAPVGPPPHEPDYWIDERRDKTYVQCFCGLTWPCPTLTGDTLDD